MKDAAKYLGVLLAFMAVAYALSWLSVFSFWFGARVFHSVTAVRAGETIGSWILAPVRVLYWSLGDQVDQSTPLYDPKVYARINGALLGILAYSLCRRWIFPGSKSRDL